METKKNGRSQDSDSDNDYLCKASIYELDSETFQLEVLVSYSKKYHEAEREQQRKNLEQRLAQENARRQAELQRQKEAEDRAQREREAALNRQRQREQEIEQERLEQLERMREQEQRLQRARNLQQLEAQIMNDLEEQNKIQHNINTQTKQLVQCQVTSGKLRYMQEQLGMQVAMHDKDILNVLLEADKQGPPDQILSQNISPPELSAYEILELIEGDSQNAEGICTGAYFKASTLVLDQATGEEADFLEFILMIFEQNSQFNFKPRKTQILAAFLLYYSYPNNLLIQMLPSEGKTVVISLLAILLVKFKSAKIDIITSSEYLARRDAELLSDVYEIFGITSGHVCHLDRSNLPEYLARLKTIYAKDIVYTTSFTAQSDFLYHTFVLDERRGARELEVCIVDEVDSMFIDKSCYSCQLSVPVPGIDYTLMALVAVYKQMEKVIDINGVWYVETSPDYLKENLVEIFKFVQDSDLLKVEDDKIILAKDLRDMFSNDAMEFDIQVVAQMEDKKWHEQIAFNDQTKECPLTIGLANLNEDSYKVMLLLQVKKEKILNEIEDNLQKSMISRKEEEKKDAEDVSCQIFVPEFLKGLVAQKMRSWLLNAVRANNHFHKKIHYEVSETTVHIIDFQNTGELQFNTQYSDALHQFLCIKEGLPLTAESLSSTHLSTSTFFKSYKTILGLSGTVGTIFDRKLLERQYQVSTVNIPRHRESRFQELPGECFDNQEDWESKIYESIDKEVDQNRAVLVICESIQMTIYLSRKYEKVKFFQRSDDDLQVKVIGDPIQPKDIVFATLVGARGADLDASLVESQGGIHIIFSFMPANTRVELQGFYRTARAGKSGSGQILFLKGLDYEDCETFSDCRLRRDLVAIGQIEFYQERFKEIEFNDRLYLMFLDLYLAHRQQFLNDEGKISIHGTFALRELQFQFGLLLKEVEEKGNQWVNFDQFTAKFYSSMESLEYQNPFFLVLCANEMFKKKANDSTDFEDVINLYSNAIQCESSYIMFPAYINRAAAIIRMKGDRYKDRAKSDLQKGLELMSEAMQQLVIMATMVQSLDSMLTRSISEKLDVLALLKSNYSTALDQVSTAEDSRLEVLIKPISSLIFNTNISIELLIDLEESGIIGAIDLKKKQSYFAPILIGVIALAQIAGGACLMVMTGGLAFQLGQALLCEGISDIIYVISSSIQGNCNLKDYAIQKAVSMTVSLTCFAVGKLYQSAKTAFSASKNAIQGASTVMKNGTKVLSFTMKNVKGVILGELANQASTKMLMIGADVLVDKLKDLIRLKLKEQVALIISEQIADSKLEDILKQLIQKTERESVIRFIELDGKALLIQEDELMQYLNQAAAVLGQISEVTKSSKLKTTLNLIQTGAYIFDATKCLIECKQITSTFIPKVIEKLEGRLNQYKDIEDLDQHANIKLYIGICNEKWTTLITEELMARFCSSCVSPVLYKIASKAGKSISESVKNNLESINPELMGALQQKRAQCRIDQIGGRKTNSVMERNYLFKQALKSGLIEGGKGVLKGGLSQGARNYFSRKFNCQEFTDQFLNEGFLQFQIEQMISMMYEHGLIDKKSDEISDNYAKMIENAGIDDDIKQQLLIYFDGQMSLSKGVLKAGLKQGIIDGAYGAVAGYAQAKEELKLVENWIKEHDERKRNSPYVDKVDIQDYANMKNVNILILNEDGSIKESIQCGNPEYAETKTIVLSDQHFAEQGEDNFVSKDCFFFAMGEENPDSAKLELYLWRQANPDLSHRDALIAELLNEENYLKGSGRVREPQIFKDGSGEIIPQQEMDPSLINFSQCTVNFQHDEGNMNDTALSMKENGYIGEPLVVIYMGVDENGKRILTSLDNRRLICARKTNTNVQVVILPQNYPLSKSQVFRFKLRGSSDDPTTYGQAVKNRIANQGQYNYNWYRQNKDTGSNQEPEVVKKNESGRYIKVQNWGRSI